MAELRVTELDFDTIKINLRSFLQSQEEFKDYNFDGSGFAVILDILAYNTHYNAMLAHLVANEQFIDTAIKRSSVVSLAKSLGYIPRSAKSAITQVKLVVTPVGNPPATMTLPTSTLFTTSIDGQSFNFSVKNTQTVSSSQGTYTFDNVDLIEGARLAMTYTVQSDTVTGPFVIPNQAVDLDTVLVTVRENSTSTTVTAYTRVTSVLDAQPSAQIYWLEETPDGNYSVIFGDGILGAALVPGNVVTITYIASSGPAANGAKKFSLTGTINGSTIVAITLINAAGAFGGADREDIDSIRFHAPKFNSTRNRAVTAQDYKSLIKSQYPNINSVAVWGGEDNQPPIFGKVFISLDPLNNQIITQTIKDYIANTIIKPRSVVSIQPVFVDPEYLYVTLNVQTKYDLTQTVASSADIASYVSTTITNYFTSFLGRLDTVFYYSKMLRAIDTTTSSIIGSLVTLSLQKRIAGTTTGSNVTLNYNGSVVPNSIRSSYFQTTVGGVNYIAYLRDIPSVIPPKADGTGALGLYSRDTDLLLDPNYGTVNYSTGYMNIPNIIVSGYIGSLTDVRVNATPQELSKNVSPTVNRTTDVSIAAIYPLASRNTIIKLDDTTEDPGAGVSAGLSVTAIPYVERA